MEIFFTQVFQHNFFHADMHPGNIFVGTDGRYMAVDFGIMGTLNPVDQRYLAENFLAFFRRDYRRVAELHVESEWVPDGTRVDEFESAIRTVCEPIFEKPLKEISFGNVLLRLFQTARRFNMVIQPQLVLLQKTLLNIEGLGRQLYPDLDLWQTAKPFLERTMSEQLGARSLLRNIKQNLPEWNEHLPELPTLAWHYLEQATSGKLRVEWTSREVQKLRREVQLANRRTISAIVGTGLVITAAIIYGLDGYAPTMLLGAPLLTWITGCTGVFLLLYNWPGGTQPALSTPPCGSGDQLLAREYRCQQDHQGNDPDQDIQGDGLPRLALLKPGSRLDALEQEHQLRRQVDTYDIHCQQQGSTQRQVELAAAQHHAQRGSRRQQCHGHHHAHQCT